MATANDVLIRVRQRIGDMAKVDFSDEELLYCLNNAMDALSIELAQQKTADIVKTFRITNDEEVVRPDDYISFVGQYPLETMNVNGVVKYKHIDPNFSREMEVKYYAMQPRVRALTDEIPNYRDIHMKALMEKVIYEIYPDAGKKQGDSE